MLEHFLKSQNTHAVVQSVKERQTGENKSLCHQLYAMKTKYITPSDDSSRILLNISVTVTDYESEEIRFHFRTISAA